MWALDTTSNILFQIFSSVPPDLLFRAFLVQSTLKRGGGGDASLQSQRSKAPTPLYWPTSWNISKPGLAIYKVIGKLRSSRASPIKLIYLYSTTCLAYFVCLWRSCWENCFVKAANNTLKHFSYVYCIYWPHPMKDFKRWNYWRGSRSSANFEVQELNLNTLVLLEQPWLEVQHQSHKAVACSKSFILCSKTHVSGTFKLTLILQKTPFMYNCSMAQYESKL